MIDHWEQSLRAQASLLPSLKYFQPAFMSLTHPHPVYTTCGNSPYEVSKAAVQARFLSGRARLETLTRHWDMSNPGGLCTLCRTVAPTLGTLEHILLSGG